MGKLPFWIALLLICGCAHAKNLEAPKWVVKVPQKVNEICAVGTSDATFFREDAREFAAESARQELARTLSVDIYSTMIDKQGKYESDTSLINITEISTKLSGSQIVAYWYDQHGIAPLGEKGMTFALACVNHKMVTQ